MESDRPGTGSDDQHHSGDESTARHDVSGTVIGHVVQARSISGDVHFHGRGEWTHTPRQLPARVSSFVNRTAEIAALDRHADEAGPGIAVIAGGPGSGKTALALHWAHSVRDRFPDGDLFVNLRGYDASPPLSADAVLDRFLRTLDVPPGRIPEDTDAKAAMFRSVLAERKILIVLDNGSAAEQIRPLLPGSDGCATIITSRSRLAGLTARDGAKRLDLNVLPEDEALTLLRAVAGAERVDGAGRSAAELARLCGYLPLALRIAGDYVASHPFTDVAELVDDLNETGRRLAALGEADQVESVRAVFSWSYRSLPEAEARTFRLLGLHVGHDIDVEAAAALLGVAHAEARRLLESLAGAHLLDPVARNRYAMHDLLRAYAAELVGAEVDPRDADASSSRLFQWYLHTATNAARLLPARRLAPLAEPDPAVSPREFDDESSALAWCEQERTTLASIVRTARDRGANKLSWQLATQLGGFYNLRKYWNDWIATFTVALDAADNDEEAAATAWLLTSLGIAYRDLRRFQESLDCFSRAMSVFAASGDLLGEESARNNAASTLLESGRAAEALPEFQDAAEAYRRLGNSRAAGRSLSNAGAALTAMGRAAEAVPTMRLALEMLEEAGDRHGLGFTLYNLGEAFLGAGNPEQALAAFDASLAHRIDTGNTWGEARTRFGRGQAFLECGRAEEAVAELETALHGFEETGTPVDTARVSLVLARALVTIGQPDQANTVLFRAVYTLGPAESALADELSTALSVIGEG